MDILSYILGKKAGGGGGEAVLVNKNIDANGTYNASSDSADGYKKVVVDVPNTYAAGDDGKVVSNGALVSQGSASYTSNGTYDTTLVDEVEVAVSGESAVNELLSNATSGAYRNATLTSFRRYAFSYMTNITSIHLDAATTIQGADAFSYTSAQVIVLPALTNNTSYGMRDAREMTTFDVGPSWKTMSIYWFNACNKLDTIILRSSTPVAMQSTNALDITKFKNGGAGGHIYIPKSLYDHLGDGTANDYKALSNWSTYNRYGTITWHAIEGSIYETQYADGTPIA